MSKKKKKQMSLQEALGTRSEVPEPTEDEMVKQALANDQTEKILQQPTDEMHETNTKPRPKKETPITPASNTDLPPAPKTSTPESPSPKGFKIVHKFEQGNEATLRRLKEYIVSEEYNVNWVRLHLTHLGRIPSAIPVMTLWEVPPSIDIPQLIYDTVHTAGYLENIWPALSIVMGSSRDNLAWTAGVMTTMALFAVIQELPILLKYKEGKSENN